LKGSELQGSGVQVLIRILLSYSSRWAIYVDVETIKSYWYLKIPAIILLPIWIGNELFQLFFGNGRYVAHVAHIGGLTGGTLFGVISLKFPAVLNREIFEEASVDEISPLMEKALQHIAELDMEGGRELLKHILEKDPENVDALTHLFNIYKLDPENHKFHETAKKLIFQLSRSYSAYESAHKIYQEYIRQVSAVNL